MNDLLADLQYRMRIRQIPGLSIRVAENGNELFNRELGVSDLSSGERLERTHLFRVGCLTKPIVAHAVLHLASQGRLDLDDSIACYIPELETRPEFCSITISHLLSHTAGLARGPYHSRTYSDKDTLLRISSSQLLFAPGEHFKYSNWGYYLLGKVIESISGDAADAFISKAVFSPLGMHRSGFADNDEQSGGDLATGYWKGWYFGSPDLAEPSVPCPHIPLPNSAAGMISTADDYLRWLISFVDEGHRVNSIEAGVVEQMLVDRHTVSPHHSACLGLFVEMIDDLPFYYLAGSSSGFSGFMFMIPDLGLVGVALGNHATCNNELREILYQVCRERVGGSFLPHFGRRTGRFNVLAGNRRSVVRFKGEDGNVPEFIRDDCRINLYPHSRNAYFMLNGDCRHQMLRISGLGKGDATITLGDQVFYERLSRLRKQPAAPESWEELAGLYRHAAFGKVEVIHRVNQIYLSYGVAYETLLQPIGGLRFKQKPGAFCFETIEFKKDPNTSEVVSFVLNEMVFLRQFQPRIDHQEECAVCLHGDSG
ncbi:serine hydrolase [Nitrosospira sp. Nsp13]|uniref:serine hydrolase domain-containing protein n=1 Tax=Nitrosospira sp. Nsp13 TaxID=1855332 RepID=UPI00088E2AA3|nr:serine hydrolase domain-containing protein [Nitrosospira sp. Nsp13]SCY38009.1 CubicO group peptidase, beta-lactamase class C family [Nitrosospira sp. Nsp13]